MAKSIGKNTAVFSRKLLLILPIKCYNIPIERTDMKYCSTAEMAEKWGISERSVRNYCNQNRVAEAVLVGKTWHIPELAEKPERLNKNNGMPTNLLERLRVEKESRLSGGIYHKIMIDLTYNSNHIEGSKLTHDQTRYIFETNTIGVTDEAINTDDLVETINHFRCIDLIIDRANFALTETLIKELHSILKTGTSDSRKDWFVVGDYKKIPNEVGGKETTTPEKVPEEMEKLLKWYRGKYTVTFDDILEFHYRFEKIHPFQDGNGRVGRLIMFKECIKNNIMPFIIEDKNKMYYYRGLKEWRKEKGYLRDTCLSEQDNFEIAVKKLVKFKKQ